MKEPLVIATGNPHKVAELRAIFAERGIEVVGLKEFGGDSREPEETGKTFEENAAIKALSYAEQTGRVCLADDSGLEVDALGGAPGVISSHYSTDGVETGLSREERDAANNARLLKELESVPPEKRTGRFVCVMCVAGPPKAGGIGVPPVTTGKRVPLQSIGAGVTKAQRTLPHWQRGGETYFVTFRVASGFLTESEQRKVLSACVFWHGRRMRLFIAVVMPDHVHMLLKPLPDPEGGWFSLSRLLHSIKSYSSHEISKARGGGQVWESESYDRLVRDHEEFEEKQRYIWENPVRGGLVAKSIDYPFLVAPEWNLEQTAAAEDAARRGRQGRSDRRDAYTTSTHSNFTDGLVIATSRGTFEGRIGVAGEVPRGGHGFGYDPLFVIEDGRTSAELSPEEKNARSHRGRAAREMAVMLARKWD
jgi:putative transposase